MRWIITSRISVLNVLWDAHLVVISEASLPALKKVIE